jgi:hypothetical protein
MKNAESLSIVSIRLFRNAGNSRSILNAWQFPEKTLKHHTELKTIAPVSRNKV